MKKKIFKLQTALFRSHQHSVGQNTKHACRGWHTIIQVQDQQKSLQTDCRSEAKTLFFQAGVERDLCSEIKMSCVRQCARNRWTTITLLLWWMQLGFECSSCFSFFFVSLFLQDWANMQIRVRESENIKNKNWDKAALSCRLRLCDKKKALLRHQPSNVWVMLIV